MSKWKYVQEHMSQMLHAKIYDKNTWMLKPIFKETSYTQRRCDEDRSVGSKITKVQVQWCICYLTKFHNVNGHNTETRYSQLLNQKMMVMWEYVWLCENVAN